MELQLRNIGIIKEADIILDGLTLIAGENDTGKSTVSKALYSIVAGLNNSETYYDIYINNNILSILDDIERILDNEIINKNDINIKYHLLDRLLDDIKDINKNNKDDVIFHLKRYNLYDCISKNIDELLNVKYNSISENEKKYFSIEIQKNSEFGNQMSSFHSEKSNISILYNNNKTIDFQINNNKIDTNIPIGNIYAKDITYVETPFIFYVMDNYLDGFNIFRRRYIRNIIKAKNHIHDLFEKITLQNNIDETYLNIDNTITNIKFFSNYIRKNIGGYIEYNNEKRKFLFTKENNEIELSNTAVGIKSFAIIDLLLKAGVFNDKHILILDEPEVHLHPKWQIEYAKLMVKMAEELDIQILINSHSPYFIEAIQKYSENSEKIADRTNFYLSEKLDDSYAIIKNVNNNIESIYKTLADAYRKLDKDTLWNEVKNDIR